MKEPITMPALSTLKSNRTRVRNALVKEEQEVNELLQQEVSGINEQQIMKYSLSIGKSILSLETKLTRLETVNDKLMDAYEEEGSSEASAEFQSTLEQDSEFMDNVIDKVSQLKVLQVEVERRKRELDTNHTQNLEQHLTQVQEQMSLLQSSQTRSEQYHLQPPLPRAVRRTQTDISPYSGDVLKWNEF